MLRNNFFTIEKFSQESSSFIANVEINKQHSVFAGHFPQQPVVPGVFTLQMVRECVEQALNKKLKFSSLQNCKFSSVIIPEQNSNVQISCEYKEDNNNIQLKASVKADDISFLSLKAILIIDENNI